MICSIFNLLASKLIFSIHNQYNPVVLNCSQFQIHQIEYKTSDSDESYSSSQHSSDDEDTAGLTSSESDREEKYLTFPGCLLKQQLKWSILAKELSWFDLPTRNESKNGLMAYFPLYFSEIPL